VVSIAVVKAAMASDERIAGVRELTPTYGLEKQVGVTKEAQHLPFIIKRNIGFTALITDDNKSKKHLVSLPF
jgi:hypothetical protein